MLVHQSPTARREASSRPFRLAIVGAGWSGLSCAEALSDPVRIQAAGIAPVSICLIEAAPQPGGRARGITWLPENWQTRDPLPIDNGQHLLIGAYSATRALLARTNAQGWLQKPLQWAIPTSSGELTPRSNGGPSERLLVVPSDGGVQRLFKSVFAARVSAPFAHWPIAWKLSLGQTLARAWQSGWRADGTAAQWWQAQRLPPALLRFFWKPIVEGALNTRFEAASARVALQVLRDSLLGPAYASDTLHPLENLTHQAIAPITKTLTERGVQIAHGCRVVGLRAVLAQPDEVAPCRGGWRLEFHANSQGPAQAAGFTGLQFDAVVLALPAQVCRTLEISHTPASPHVTHAAQGTTAADLLFAQEQARWSTVRSLGVTTVYAALTPTQSQQAMLSPEILRPIAVGSGPVSMVMARPAGLHGQVISAVASATEKLHREETMALLRAALHAVLVPRLGQKVFGQIPMRATHEDQATWACTANQVDSGGAWGPSALGPLGLFRAGDDLTPGYPSCIESAVRGGIQTAEAVLALASGEKAVQRL